MSSIHRETIEYALRNLIDYVNRMSDKEITEILRGSPVYTQIRLPDWQISAEKVPGAWPLEALKLELNCEITGERRP